MTRTSTSWNTALILAISLLIFTSAAAAQSVSSGSNGSDGALDLSSTPKGSTVVFNPSNYQGNQHNINVFNFTGITIPAGVTLRVSTLQTNGPVYWLVSGNVDIEGTIDLSGQAGFPPCHQSTRECVRQMRERAAMPEAWAGQRTAPRPRPMNLLGSQATVQGAEREQH